MSQNPDNAAPETMAGLMPQTPDLRAERLAALRTLFPDLFDGEGRLQEKELRTLIDPAYHPAAERYEFPWTGKTLSKREAFTPSRAALVYDAKRSVNPDKAGGNVIIEGENLEVLKQLTAAYRERVKIIYIDPPYNTGKDFVYSDDYTEGRKPYWEESGVTERGVRVDTNSDAEGRFHSNWLSMMHARLLAARYLLRSDGFIAISIGDQELHNLRRLLDIVFGEENYIGTVSRSTGTRMGTGSRGLSRQLDYIVVYSRDTETSLGKLPMNKDELALYDQKDDRGRYLIRSLRRTGGENRREDRPSMFFPIKAPDGQEIFPVAPEGYESRWVCGRKKYAFLCERGEIEWRKVKQDGNEEWRVFQKHYLGEPFKESADFWHNVAGNKKGTKEVSRLFDSKKVFDHPKPVNLVKRILQMTPGRSSDDLVLDFFGGSGTTAEAVMDLNAADGGKRRFILVQLPEFTKEESAAHKAGYKKISDITIERNKRVIESYRKEADGLLPTDPERQHAESLGFKVYTLEKSHFPRVDFAPNPDKSEAENIELLKAYMKEKENTFALTWDRERILDEVLLKNGFMFDRTIDPAPEFTKNKVEVAKDAHRTALICLDESIAPETVDAFKGDKERIFICLEAALDTTKKWNLKHHLGDRLRAI